MATGSVSAIGGDEWQLIATNTPTSGTSTSFTNISGYSKLRLIWNTLTFAADAMLICRFNSDSGQNYIGAASGFGANTSESWSTAVALNGNNAGPYAGYLDIEDANKTFPKKLQGVWSFRTGTYGDTLNGIYIGSSAITSISLSDESSNTISSGTVYLYGIAG